MTDNAYFAEETGIPKDDNSSDKRRNFIFAAINIALPLLMGAVIYFLLYPNADFVVRIYAVFGMEAAENTCEYPLMICLIRNYLADALWAYALMMTVAGLYGYDIGYLRTAARICLIFSVVCECLQMLPEVVGTFDIIDILVEAVAIMAAVLIIKNFKRRNLK